MVITDEKRIDEVLTRGVENILPTREGFAALLASGQRLRLYCGFDPTAKSLHIGHAIQLRKLRQFQDLGHEVIMLIGSFTAMIGDPTDKAAARVQLTAEEVKENSVNWKKMATKFLRFRGENAALLMRNDKWLAKLTMREVVDLASNFTMQQMMERDMFQRRTAEGKPIYLHEFLYPLMQGYDSVAMVVDAEIGGNDQLFNMLAGRTLVKALLHKEKFVIALKLLTNDEGKKMSKSEGGFIAIDDAPEEMYGKLMAMNDGMIISYLELVTDVTMSDVDEMRASLTGGENPRNAKMRLAKMVVKQFHGLRAAVKAEKHFVDVFQKKEMPSEMVDFKMMEALTLADVLVATKLAESKGEARRLVEQGGITLDDVKLTDAFTVMIPGATGVLRRGKRQFVRLT
jgi:tyrosyl-tRNA synthetase